MFDTNGAMVEEFGWIKIFDKYTYKDIYWFYGNGDRTVKMSQWLDLGGTWYYLDYDGVMLSDCTYLENGKTYVFDSNDLMVEKVG